MNNKKAISVFTAKLARKLLKEGYTIIDIKPHKYYKNASVFVFKNENDLENKIKEYT